MQSPNTHSHNPSQDEWAELTKARAHLDQMAIQQELQMQEMTKKIQKEQLDAQILERGINQQHQGALHQQDRNFEEALNRRARESMERERMMDMQRRQYIKQTQMDYLNEYQQKQQRDQAQKLKEQQEDQLRIKQQMENLRRQENSYNDFYARFLDDHQRKQKALQNIDFQYRRKADFYNYDPEIERRNFERMKQIEEQRRKLVYVSKQATKSYLDEQVKERESFRKKQQEEKLAERQHVDYMVSHQRDYEIQRRENEVANKRRYREELLEQSSNRSLSQARNMSPQEKKLNAALLNDIRQGQAPEFRSIPGGLPPELPLQRSLNVYSRSPSPVLNKIGANTPEITPIKNRSVLLNQRFRNPLDNSFSYSPTRHDPILNPIGAEPLFVKNHAFHRKGYVSNLARAANSIFDRQQTKETNPTFPHFQVRLEILQNALKYTLRRRRRRSEGILGKRQ